VAPLAWHANRTLDVLIFAFRNFTFWPYADGQVMDILFCPKPRGVWRSDLAAGVVISAQIQLRRLNLDPQAGK
jgi:hypothetical protein